MEEAVDAITVQAPAKVNLTLHILAKRPDGYHDLDSVMQKLDLVDTIRISRRNHPGIQLSCPGSDIPEDESNLVWKAASSFLGAAGLEKQWGVSIVLDKNIPVAAGLGGGSSDAGCVLTAMNSLFKADLAEEVLLKLAKELGADVPFFVSRYSAVRATGIGDRMKLQESLKNCSLLLVNPGFSVSTAWVYENYTLTRTVKDSKLSDSRKIDSKDKRSYSLHNDLEAVTLEQYPELVTIKRILTDNGASAALMSGSGPTIFGIFPDESGSENCSLQLCAEKVRKKYGQGVFVTRPVRS